jgi:hypothetical protein
MAAVGLQNPGFEDPLGPGNWSASTYRDGVYQAANCPDPTNRDASYDEVCQIDGSDTFTVRDGAYMNPRQVTVSPVEGTHMVRLGGVFNDASQTQPAGHGHVVQQTFQVPSSADPQINLSYNIFTFDYTGFDNFGVALVDSQGSVLYQKNQGAFGAEGDTNLKSTGWTPLNIDLNGHQGQTVTLKLWAEGTLDDELGFWAYLDGPATSGASASSGPSGQSGNVEMPSTSNQNPGSTGANNGTSGPPPPQLGRSVDVKPSSGTVFVLIGNRVVPLTSAIRLTTGAIVDARRGTLTLTAASGQGNKTSTGTFGGAVFQITQVTSGPNKGLVTLTLKEGSVTGPRGVAGAARFQGAPTYASCKRGAGSRGSHKASAALSARILQTLRARASGRFRTRGRYAAGTVRGTQWTTSDRCDGTLIAVQVHAVLVTDFVRHINILVHAGHSYLARRPAKPAALRPARRPAPAPRLTG